MDPRERSIWQAADAILDSLLDLPPERRQARLEQLAEDPQVLQRVQRLLDGIEDAGPLDRPLAELAVQVLDPDAAPDLAGQRLGRWELQQWLGEGGMAVVYRATSVVPPLDQQAAVKVLSLGAVARGGRERFLREQAVLARLRHPYIAPLYEAGVAADGTPWLAMALVEGQRIDHWCSARQLDLGARLDLVEQVADALAYAHRNLVVHRDIKPSNVLVDEDGLVRLLDFGIGRELAEGGERTRTQLRALTPEYAPPEQARGEDSGTAADVYGLAALTYRLLTGRAPHLQSAQADAEVQRASQVAAAAPAASPERGFAPRLRGDLDAILRRALAADPAQRYSSIEAFVADLRRYRERRPVQARSARPGYLLRRFVQRNRWPLAAASIIFLSLLAGGLGVFWQAQRAQQANAEARLQLDYLKSLIQQLAPTTAQAREMDRSAMIRAASDQARNDLSSRPAVLATVLLTLAEVAQAAGDHVQAVTLAGEAADLRSGLYGQDSIERAQALVTRAQALWNQGRPAEAIDDTEHALAVYARRAPDSEGHVEARLLEQRVSLHQGQNQRALLSNQQTLAWCRERKGEPFDPCDRALGVAMSIHERLGELRQAERLAGELVALRTLHHGKDHAATLQAQGLRARIAVGLGEVDRAVEILESVLAAQQSIYDGTTPQVANTRTDLANALTTLGRFERARELHEAQMQAVAGELGSSHPDVAAYLGNYGVFLFKAGDFQAAVAHLADCASGYAQAGFPDHAGLHICNANRADVLRVMGRLGEAEALSRAALEGMRTIFGEDSPQLAARHSNLARILAAQGRRAEALEAITRARVLYQASANPNTGLIQLVELELRQGQGELAAAQAWALGLAARAHVDASLPALHASRILAVAPLARIACRDPALPCALLREQVLTAMAQPSTPADVRHELQAVLASTAAQG
jgi:hypothetical protein